MELYGFVRLHAREGEDLAVEEALREVTRLSRQEPGCLSIHAFRSVRDRRLFFIHSRWVDEAVFQAHADTARLNVRKGRRRKLQACTIPRRTA